MEHLQIQLQNERTKRMQVSGFTFPQRSLPLYINAINYKQQQECGGQSISSVLLQCLFHAPKWLSVSEVYKFIVGVSWRGGRERTHSLSAHFQIYSRVHLWVWCALPTLGAWSLYLCSSKGDHAPSLCHLWSQPFLHPTRPCLGVTLYFSYFKTFVLSV